MKLYLFSSLLALVLMLNGCSNPLQTPSENPTDSGQESEEAFVTDDYVGLSLAEAEAYAKARNVPFRVVERDGKPLPVTMDYRPGRINAAVEDGVVVSYQVEGQETNNSTPEEKPVSETYDGNSWKTMIDDRCESFFDGCNTCRRMPGEAMAACTRMFCQNYDQPRCLDDDQTSGAPEASSFGGRTKRYACDNDNTFRVAYDQYIDDSGIVRLQPNQVMFEDDQTETKVIMSRTVAASGEKYEAPTGLVFWSQGLSAQVLQGDTNLYENCEEI